MFRWLKRRLIIWALKYQGYDIARLRQEAARLREELERETGQPFQLTPDERRKLAEKAAGIDPEILKQISIFGPEILNPPDQTTESTENQ